SSDLECIDVVNVDQSVTSQSQTPQGHGDRSLLLRTRITFSRTLRVLRAIHSDRTGQNGTIFADDADALGHIDRSSVGTGLQFNDRTLFSSSDHSIQSLILGTRADHNLTFLRSFCRSSHTAD